MAESSNGTWLNSQMIHGRINWIVKWWNNFSKFSDWWINFGFHYAVFIKYQLVVAKKFIRWLFSNQNFVIPGICQTDVECNWKITMLMYVTIVFSLETGNFDSWIAYLDLSKKQLRFLQVLSLLHTAQSLITLHTAIGCTFLSCVPFNQ